MRVISKKKYEAQLKRESRRQDQNAAWLRELRAYLSTVNFPQKRLRCSVELTVKQAGKSEALFLELSVNGFKDSFQIGTDPQKIEYLARLFPVNLMCYIGDLVTSGPEDPTEIELVLKRRTGDASLPKNFVKVRPMKQGGQNKGKGAWPVKRRLEALEVYEVFTSKIKRGDSSLGPRPTDGDRNRSGELADSEWAYRLTAQHFREPSRSYVEKQILAARKERRKQLARRGIA